ncbi:MAG: D-glycerate dehydrogenase [Deltaproteobacteria bacterium]|nr:D-glycerate dehydrogenase [Deltaproteobacteria bacterium]
MNTQKKVLVTAKLPEDVIESIKVVHDVEAYQEIRPMERAVLLQRVVDKDGLLCTITDRIDEELLCRAPGLKVIANYGVGYNNIDVEAATKRGIPVSNTPDVLTDATADIAMALILASARRLVEGDKRVREGQFTFWAPMHFLGSEVTGKTLGIVGLGRIGRAVARRAKGFDMRILYHNRNRIETIDENALGITFVTLDTLLSESDFISLHVPLTEQTHHLIGPEELVRMKSNAYLINTSRGPVVDEKALVEAIERKQIAGAGLDVYENEPRLTPGLAGLDNVVLLPHVGSATLETRTAMARLAAENLLAGLKGDVPPNCVNPSFLD